MTPSAPRSPALRLAAVLVFIGLPALFLTLALLDMLQIAADRDTVRESRMQADALARRLSRSVARGPVAAPVLFVEGASRTAASARLQQSVLDAITAAEGRIIETAVPDAPASEGDDDRRIAVRTTFDIGNDGLLTLLYGLESGLPLMDVDSLSIRRLQDTGMDTSLDTGNGENAAPIVLRVDMAVGAGWKPTGEAGS